MEELKTLQVVPAHIAAIMDGNGRWAKKRHLPRPIGHKYGFDAFVEAVKNCDDLGVSYFTVYAFSTENWKREKSEIDGILSILNSAIAKYVPLLMERNIRLRILGDYARFDDSSDNGVSASVRKLQNNTGMTLSIALGYGGRDEILHAVNALLAEGKPSATEADFERHLYTAGIPDPDLIIRTSGEERISNFLLWQCAYSEFYFSDKLWPDFDKAELYRAIESYGKRERRFGK